MCYWGPDRGRALVVPPLVDRVYNPSGLSRQLVQREAREIISSPIDKGVHAANEPATGTLIIAIEGCVPFQFGRTHMHSVR